MKFTSLFGINNLIGAKGTSTLNAAAFLTASALVLNGIIACQPSAKIKSENNTVTANGPVSYLLTTRPEKSGPLKVIIRLPADPLSKVSKEELAGQLALIQEQQKQLKDKLKSVSSDIQIIFTYKTLINGLYVVIPENLASKVDPLIPNGSRIESATSIEMPDVKVQEDELSKASDLTARNSVKFIGAEKLHEQGIKGQNVRVGIIDTGIDYTHSMLGGSGSAEEFKSINPSQSTPQFPNKKVVGGYDFVGTEYDAGSPNPLLRIPKPDANPLDEAGHGSHVAGTVAGVSNGANNYNGVAPDALLYALKVFGKDGSTDDAIVIAALEFAADPDDNPETKDQLDVVNLSLGSSYGSPKLLYSEAIANLNSAGTVIVASAGNSGDKSYITGSPAVSDEALSVAASIDDMDHNWHFSAASFKLSEDNEVVADMSEATFSKPLEKIDQMAGKLVYIGLAKVVTEEQASLLKGNIALIDRGEIPFVEKVKNALDAGAIAAVVINHTEGNPFTMGGGDNESLDIPAIMIGLTPGKSIRDSVVNGSDVIANLKSDKKISKPELIDTLTDFSSRGPRSGDSIIKPEISAPGSNIISAKVGGGGEVVSMSGTSMAAPHMAGVIALLKQTHQSLSAQELKSLAMLTSKSINNEKGEVYPIALQGAGRVQADLAKEAHLTVVPAAVSIGRIEVNTSKIVSRKIVVKNIDDKDVSLKIETKLNKYLQVLSPTSIDLKSNEEKILDLKIKVSAPAEENFDHELDGFIKLVDQNNQSYSLPVLAMVLKISNIKSGKLKVLSSSAEDASGSLSTLELENSSPNMGPAFIFNLLGKDEAKNVGGLQNRSLNNACDLESVGYRTVVTDIEGKKVEVLQMAIKLYDPLSTWNMCEFSVQIDSNGDGVADQELAGVDRSNTEGLGSGFASLLLDATKARSIRKDYEKKLESQAEKPILDFSGAVENLMDILAINQSSIMIIQTPVSSLKTVPGHNLRVKVGSLSLDQDAIEANDFLGKDWLNMPLSAQAQSLSDIPEVITLNGKSQIQVSLTKGEGTAPLIIYYPQNHASMTSAEDLQSQVLELEYTVE